MKKSFFSVLTVIMGIVLLLFPMTLIIIFISGINYFELENSVSRIGWAYFHFASIYGLYWLLYFIAISCKIKGYGLTGKYHNHFIYISSILAILLFSYYYSYKNDDVLNTDKLNNAITIFFIMLLPCVIGIHKGLEVESRMTIEEKQKLNID